MKNSIPSSSRCLRLSRAHETKETYPVHLHELARRSEVYPSRPSRPRDQTDISDNPLSRGGESRKKKKKRRDEVEDKEKSTIIGRPMERNTRGLAQIAVSSNKPTERELASTNWNQTSLPSSLFFSSSVFFSYWPLKRGLKEGA